MTDEIEIKTAGILIGLIKEEINKAKPVVQTVVDTTKVAAFWKIGHYIKIHLNYKKDKENYGKALMEQIAAETDIGLRTLYLTVQFYEGFPGIGQEALPACSWTHYCLLLRIKEPEKRAVYLKKVTDKHMSSVELESLLKNDRVIVFNEQRNGNRLTESKGLPFFYRLKQVAPKTTLYIDCGFRIFKELLEGSGKYAADTMIESEKQGKAYVIKPAGDKNPMNLYYYLAYVKEIIDGDTLWVNIDLGFGLFSCQKVRPRGISAEAPDTDAGVRAKEFVASSLGQGKYLNREMLDKELVGWYAE